MNKVKKECYKIKQRFKDYKTNKDLIIELFSNFSLILLKPLKINKPLTRNQLIKMIENDEDVTKCNTSKIKDFSLLFNSRRRFNQDLSSWDVSSGKDYSYMFYNCEDFNQDLSSWDVISKNKLSWINLESMFNGCNIKKEFKPKNVN